LCDSSDAACAPAVYTAWIGLTIIAAIMFLLLPMFAAKELAPTEDQGVIFGYMTASADRTDVRR
jgi:multidrug efflux pump